MKKVFSLISILFIMTSGSVLFYSKNKKEQINELFLKNIECLATPENPVVTCFHQGSVDCPGHNVKVLIYW